MYYHDGKEYIINIYLIKHPKDTFKKRRKKKK